VEKVQVEEVGVVADKKSASAAPKKGGVKATKAAISFDDFDTWEEPAEKEEVIVEVPKTREERAAAHEHSSRLAFNEDDDGRSRPAASGSGSSSTGYKSVYDTSEGSRSYSGGAGRGGASSSSSQSSGCVACVCVNDS
jgi:hypothetical protein